MFTAKEQAGKFFSFPEKGNSSSSSLQSIGELLKQFIPRNLKLGQIYGFLDVAGLENSKTEFAEVVKLIKVRHNLVVSWKKSIYCFN